jgi:pimeloyl-ACP methyl ester carboxylesterase
VVLVTAARSGGDPATWSFEPAADGIRDFCDAVGIARPVVYGHSLGGMVALVYAGGTPAARARWCCSRPWPGPYRQELEVAPCASRVAATSSPAV